MEDMPTLNLEKNDGKEYETFIKGISQQFPNIPNKTPSLVEEQGTKYRCKAMDTIIDECFEISIDEGKVDIYQKMIEDKIDECFPNPDPSQSFQNPDPSPDVGVRHRTYLLEEFEFLSKPGQPPIDWVFQVSLIHEELTLDILIQKFNLYLVGYKGKVEMPKEDKMEGNKIEKQTVESWILLDGNHRNRVKAVILSQDGNLIEPIEAKLDTSYLSLFSKSESGFTEEVREEQSKGLYNKLKDKLKKTKEEVVKRKDYAEGKLKEQKRNASSKQNLLEWLPNFFAALEANRILEREGAKVKRLGTFLADEIERKKRSKAYDLAVKKLEGMQQKWKEQVKGEVQENDRFGKQITSVDNLLGWLEKINIAGKAAEKVDKDSKSKNLRMYLASSLKKLQKESITAEKLIKKLEKEYSRMTEHTSAPDESWLISWVKEYEKGVEILERLEKKQVPVELDGERKFKKQVPVELKTELAPVEKLVKKLEKRFPLGKESTQEIKTETSQWKAVLEKQNFLVPDLDWHDFYQDLKCKADHLKAAMQVLYTDAYSNIVRNKTQNLKLNREALINAVKHLTTKPFDDDKDSATHIIILIQMICEATRFGDIANHISDNYTKDDAQTAPLSTEMIGLQHKWTEGSSIITREQYTTREESSWKEAGLSIPEVFPTFTVIRSRNEQQLREE